MKWVCNRYKYIKYLLSVVRPTCLPLVLELHARVLTVCVLETAMHVRVCLNLLLSAMLHADKIVNRYLSV